MNLCDFWFGTEKFYSMIVGSEINATFWYMGRTHDPMHVDTYGLFGTLSV